MATFQYQFGKDGLKYVDPMTFMGVRYVLAGVVCFAIARNFRPVLNKDTLLVSFFMFSSSAFWIFGLQDVSPAQSAVLSYTMPLFAIPLSMVLIKEKASRLVWAGAIIGFLGVAVYSFALTTEGGSIIGQMLTVANAVCWALYSVYMRKLRVQDPVRTVGTQFTFGGLLYLLFVPFTFSLDPTPQFFVDLGYVTFIGGVASLIVWSLMLRLETVGRITTLVFAVPATSVIVQSLLTRQLPTPLSLAGICVMFTGIYVSRIKSERQLPMGAATIDTGIPTKPD